MRSQDTRNPTRSKLPSPRSHIAQASLGELRPVRARVLPYGRHAITEDDIQAVVRVLRSPWITTGPQVNAFEEAIAAQVGAKHAVAFSSGTAALHAAVFAAGLGPGDEAITTPLTFCATANCVLYQGATPKFADVSSDTLTMDPDCVTKRITGRTKALLPVDYAGHPADVDALLALADRHGLVVIEDACHALGAAWRGKQIGSLSHLTVFSFHPVKHITTGEGGMVTTNNPRSARRLRMFRNHGIESDANLRRAHGEWYYEMRELGYNYRLSDIGCALGISQLRRLESILARRRQIAEAYTAAFRTLEALEIPTVRPDVEPAWHLYPIRLRLERLTGNRKQVFQALRKRRIGVQVHFIPVHLQPYYRNRFGYRRGECPVAEDAYDCLISLPIFPGMTDQDVTDVIDSVREVLQNYGCASARTHEG